MSLSERPVRICYNSPSAAVVDRAKYDAKKAAALKGVCNKSITVEKKTARAWTMKKDELCRISVTEGSQVSLIKCIQS